MSLPPVIDFKQWLSENEEFLKPPVNNRCIQLGHDFLVMVVGGPNARTDFHINETEVLEYAFDISLYFVVGVVLSG